MAVAYCIACGGRIYLGNRPWVGQGAFCDRCGADLEVTNTSPLILDWTDYAGDDWDEEASGMNADLVSSSEFVQ
jgi:lysine biosynthesis protein LysW